MTILKESMKDRIFKGHTMRGMLKKTPLVVAFWLLSHGMDVNAADFTPSSTADTVNGTVVSLRDAVIAANGSTTVDRIVLGSGTYALSIPGRNEDQALTGDLDITRSVDSEELTIEGTGTTTTIIDGASIDRVFHITSAGKVKFKNLTIKGGLATDDAGLSSKLQAPLSKDANGGAIASKQGVLTFENVSIESNEARAGDGTSGQSTYGGYAQGGGIYTSGGSLTFTGGAVKNNQANAGKGLTGVLNPGGGGGAKGGGVYADYSNPGTPIVGTGLEVSGNSAIGGAGGSAIAGYGGNSGGYSQGGGIGSNEGSVTLTNSKIVKNIARSGAGGRGGDGRIALSDSNGGSGGSGGYGGSVQGGGLYVFFASMDMTGCEISDNQVISGPAGDGGNGGSSQLARGGSGGAGGSNYNSTRGGGVYVEAFKIQNPFANFTNCSIARNSVVAGAGGNGGSAGIGFDGSNGVAGYGGRGGDVQSAAIDADFGTPLSIVNSTVSKNTATAGNGGIGTSFSGANGGSIGYGGAITANPFFGGNFELKNSTVVQNSSISGQAGTGAGAGSNFSHAIYSSGGSVSTVISSIVAQNTANGTPADIQVGVDETATNNLIGDATAITGLTDPSNKTGTTASPLNPLLDVLKNNGGNTETHALLPGSPALESGVPNGLTFDQRGDGYPRTAGITDIGAFENHAPTADAGGPYEINEGDPLSVDGSKSKGDAPLTYTWDINGDGTFGDATGVTPTLTAAQLTTLGIVGGQTYAVKIKVSDGINAPVTANATLKVNIVQNSPPTVSPNDPTVGETVVVTTNSQSDTTIDWGDGTVNTSSSHVYATPGSYVITVTTPSGSTKLTVVVSGLLKVIRLRGGLGVSGADTNLVRLTADIPDAAGLKIAGAKITVDVGGAAANFILDGKGRVHQEFKDNGGSISKPKKDGTRRLFVSMLGDWLPLWADEKIQPSTTGRQSSTNMLVKFTIDGIVYVSNVKVWLSPRPNAVRLFDSNIKRPGG